MAAIYQITEDDLQDVALDQIGRELTVEEMESAVHYFEKSMGWWDTAVEAVGLAESQLPRQAFPGQPAPRQGFFAAVASDLVQQLLVAGGFSPEATPQGAR